MSLPLAGNRLGDPLGAPLGDLIGTLHLPLVLETKALAATQRQLAVFLATGGCASDVRFRVELVVEEVVMNVIRHAHPQGATHAALHARCADGQAAIAIEDDGPAFDPLAAPLRPLEGALVGNHEGGFGLHLIRRHSDAAQYARSEGLNRLELEFGPRPA